MLVVGAIIVVFAILLMAGAQKAHKDETGVPGPSRQAMANIRRAARRKDISETQAYDEWLSRKQKAALKQRSDG